MGHYDSCRDGYCGGCGAAPGNMVNGKCPFCEGRRRLFKESEEKEQPKILKVKDSKPSKSEYEKALAVIKAYEKNK